LLKALAAKHGTALRGFERDGSFFAALRASGPGFNLLIAASGMRRPHMGYAFVLAGLAAFGFILELLVVKEELLPRRKNKFSPLVRPNCTARCSFTDELLEKQCVK
jgi:hypothetical protein